MSPRGKICLFVTVSKKCEEEHENRISLRHMRMQKKLFCLLQNSFQELMLENIFIKKLQTLKKFSREQKNLEL